MGLSQRQYSIIKVIKICLEILGLVLHVGTYNLSLVYNIIQYNGTQKLAMYIYIYVDVYVCVIYVCPIKKKKSICKWI